jgi:hypothetical protein
MESASSAYGYKRVLGEDNDQLCRWARCGVGEESGGSAVGDLGHCLNNVYISCFGVRIRCSVMRKLALQQEVLRTRNSQAQWTLGEWMDAMDSLKNMGCWGSMSHGGRRMTNERKTCVKTNPSKTSKTTNRLTFWGVVIRCSELHKSALHQEVHRRRCRQAETEWTVMEWNAEMESVNQMRCWVHTSDTSMRSVKRTIRLVDSSAPSVMLSCFGVRVRCSVLHKLALHQEVLRRRSSQAEWTVLEWHTAMVTVKNMMCWGIEYRCKCLRDVEGCKACGGKSGCPRVYCFGVWIRCSKFYTHELRQTVQLRWSSRARAEWTLGEWQAEMITVKNMRCWNQRLPLWRFRCSVKSSPETYDTYCAQQVTLQVVSNSLAIGSRGADC